MRIALISAPRRQLPFPARPARLFSPSEWFVLAYTHARHTTDRIYILSPQHGLLRADGPPLAPYQEDSLDHWPQPRRHRWTERVLSALLPQLHAGDTIVFYAGRAARSEIQYKLTQQGYSCEVPLQGLSPDAQMARLHELVGTPEDLNIEDDPGE